jgi:hypothetical protein
MFAGLDAQSTHVQSGFTERQFFMKKPYLLMLLEQLYLVMFYGARCAVAAFISAVGLTLSACGGGSSVTASPTTNPALQAAIVSDYSPSSGAEGTKVTFTGTGFDTTPGAYVVKFAGQVAEIFSQTATSVVVLVPRGAQRGLLSFQASDWGVTSTEDFVVVAGEPSIEIVSPRQASVGGQVTIRGDFFGSTPVDNEVTINGVPLEVLNANRTTLTLRVPPNVGSGKLIVRTGGVNATSPESFFVIPKITSFSPTTITQGETVTVTGTNLTRDTQVRVGTDAVLASVVTAQGTEMTVVVPAPAKTGGLYITNPEGVGDVSTTQLKVNSLTLPTIARFAPAYGQPGTRITVFGTNFRATPAQNIVKIGGVNATVTAVSASAEGPYMWVTVPTMTPGFGYQISITTPEGTSALSRAGFDIAELPRPATGVSVSPSSIAFGTVFTGSYSEQAVTVTNTGAVSVKLSGAAVTGANFRYTGTTCYGYNYQLVAFDTLAPGASCTFDVDFGPTAVATSYGALSFTAAGVVQTVALQGSGAAPLVPMPSFTPLALSFEGRELGTTSAPKTARLVNAGTAPLTFDSTIGLPVGGEFDMTHNCPATLQPGQGCDLSVSFKPVRFVGAKEGSVVLVSNYVSSTLPTIKLTGAGTLARSGQLAVVTTASWGIQNTFLDGAWIGKLTRERSRACGDPGAVPTILAPGAHTVSASDPLLRIADAVVTVVEGQCVTHNVTGTATCVSPNFISGGLCYPPSQPTCVAPAVLRNGACVVPGNTASPGNGTTVGSGGVANGGNGGVAGELLNTGTGVGAAHCLRFGQVTGEAASWSDKQTMTNTCGYQIYVMWCHSPSKNKGTNGSQCNADSKFYQQGTWMDASETQANQYSMPIGSTIWYGACSGGKYSQPSGKEIAATGRYICE